MCHLPQYREDVAYHAHRMTKPKAQVPYLQVIRSPRYFPLWLGQIVSNLGDTVNYVAVVVLVFRLSHSGIAVSTLVVAEIVPALLTAASTLFNPALQAVLPTLLSEKERLAANSVAWSSGRLMQIVGASVAGGLIAWAGTTPAFLANAASFAFSAAMIVRLAIPPYQGPPRTGGLGTWLRAAREGLVYARRDPFVARLVPDRPATT